MKRIKKVLAVCAFLASTIPFLGAGLWGLYISSKYISPPWDKVLLGLIILCVAAFVRAHRRRAKDYKENKKAADQGFADAQNNLGFMYQYGQGVAPDFKEAVKWYHKAADQGFAGAQNNLGVVYERGQGVEQDYVTAYAWGRIAAANGVDIAKETKSILARKMNPVQIAKAEELVKEMVEKNPKLLNK
jgi:TPR repeat protein